MQQTGEDRKGRIVKAALDDIIELGLHRTTHRSIATRARVSPGSLTYYFSGLEDLFEAAFELMYESLAADYQAKLAAAQGFDQAVDAVVDVITRVDLGDKHMRALFEMYSYGGHNPAVRDHCRRWLSLSREALRHHFSDDAAHAIDALVEGWPMHEYFEREPLDREKVRSIVALIGRAG